MLTLYKSLENVVTSIDKSVSGSEKAKCAEITADLILNVLKIEAEGIKAIQEIISNNKTNKGQRCLNNLSRSESEIKEYDPNRKF